MPLLKHSWEKVANFLLVSGKMKSETSMWTLKIHGSKQLTAAQCKRSYDVSFCVYIYITSTLMFYFHDPHFYFSFSLVIFIQ